MPSEAKGWEHRGRSGQSSHDPPMVPRADPCGAQSDETALAITPGLRSAAALGSPTTSQLVLRAPPERLRPAVVRPVGRGHQQSGAGGRVDPNRLDALVRAVRPPLVRRVVPRVTSTTTAPGWTTGRSVQSSKYLRTMTARVPVEDAAGVRGRVLPVEGGPARGDLDGSAPVGPMQGQPWATDRVSCDHYVPVTAPLSAPSDRSRLARFAWLAIAAALLTIALKTGAWLVTDSVGLLSDAAESVVNLVAAVGALIALKVAAAPADETHHFGHAKAEYFSAAVEGAMIAVAALVIIWQSVLRLLDPRPLQDVGVGLAISVLASVVNGLVALVLIRAGRAHRSITLTADGKHLLTDVWS